MNSQQSTRLESNVRGAVEQSKQTGFSRDERSAITNRTLLQELFMCASRASSCLASHACI